MNEDDQYIIFTNSEGEELKFIELGRILKDDVFYYILKPVEQYDDMEKDEILVFRAKNGIDDNNFEIVLDDDIIKEVLDIYYKEASNEKK